MNSLKDYKRYTILLLFFVAVILLVVYPLIFYLRLGVPSEKTRYLNDWLEVKTDYAKSIHGPKLVVISGSNSLFGISAETIEQECKIPTVNFGIHAGLGLKYILYKAKTFLNEGDIVLLPLEYDMYSSVEQYGGEYTSFILARDSEYFRNKDVIEKFKMIYSISPLDIIDTFRKVPLNPKDVYSGKGLNKNGDLTTNIAENRWPDEELTKLIVQNVFEDKPYPSDKSKDCLIDFIDFCKDKNIRVLVTYPVYLFHSKFFEGHDLKAIEGIQEFWAEQSSISVLGQYEEALYDPKSVGYFFNTIHHLNDIGREKRTEQLIRYLKPIIDET